MGEAPLLLEAAAVRLIAGGAGRGEAQIPASVAIRVGGETSGDGRVGGGVAARGEVEVGESVGGFIDSAAFGRAASAARVRGSTR